MTVPVVGALLIFTLMIGPPAAARCFTDRALVALGLSVVMALITIWAALACAFTTNWPVGFYVGSFSAAWFVIGRSSRRCVESGRVNSVARASSRSLPDPRSLVAAVPNLRQWTPRELLLDCRFPWSGSKRDLAVSGGADSLGLLLLALDAELEVTCTTSTTTRGQPATATPPFVWSVCSERGVACVPRRAVSSRERTSKLARAPNVGACSPRSADWAHDGRPG